ncbi:MAG: aldehyde dehydrogenase family protein [Bryobacterales bacterium]|nr:aldehyde dehydrogenase family protein [Bryobacterales bacterium]
MQPSNPLPMWNARLTPDRIDGIPVLSHPATDKLLANVANGGAPEARGAVDRAEGAAERWRSMLVKSAVRLLLRFAAFMLQEQDSLAALCEPRNKANRWPKQQEIAVCRILPAHCGRRSREDLRRPRASVTHR